MDALTLEQVTAAAQRYLRRDRYVRVVLLPEAAAADSATE
jgi:predicted Zn-dependent peptidase